MKQLRIGGMTPLTTIDYPGELAAVIYCQGCPWRCRYCHNGHLIPNNQPGSMDWESAKGFLQHRFGLLDAVVISGGEPTLQSALPNAIREIKAMGYKVGLHTAGCYPQRLKQLLPMIDWVALDIKELARNYLSVTQTAKSGAKAWKSLNLVLDSGIDYEIRTTRMPGHSDDQIAEIASRLADLGVRRYALQYCQTGMCFDPTIERHFREPSNPDLLRHLENTFQEFTFRS